MLFDQEIHGPVVGDFLHELVSDMEKDIEDELSTMLQVWLEEGEVILTFNDNGDKRNHIKRATLNKTLMIDISKNEDNHTHETDDDSIAVWDLTAKEWVSFRKDISNILFARWENGPYSERPGVTQS